MSFESLTNHGEFFSNHFLDEVIAGHLGDIRSIWDEAEAKGASTSRTRLKRGGSEFFTRLAAINESSEIGQPAAVQSLHDHVLTTLGYEPDRLAWELKQNTEHVLDVQIAARVETSTGLLLVAIEAGNATSVDDLFGFDIRTIADGVEQPGQLLDPVFRNVDKRTIFGASDGVGEIFGTDEPPRYVLVLAGTILLLAERAKWAEGRYLAVDLGLAFDRNDARAKGELETIAALFSGEALTPTDGQSTFETLVDNSHKHAVGVSKELRNGIRASIEIIANEVIEQRDERARRQNKTLFTRTDVDARDLTRQSLRYLYRLIVLLYAESRPRLGIVPADDEAYVEGYSLDRLRELCLVDLEDDHARNGTHFQQSLDRLFELVNGGYHAEEAEQQLLFDEHDHSNDADRVRSEELYIQFPGLDAQLFDPVSTSLINEVPLRNEALQRVLRHLTLATGSGNNSAGFISYAQLGINQLGAVYEGLMAYTGFYADTDLYEVAKNGEPKDGTWMLPVADADGYPDDVFITRTDEFGKTSRVLHENGTFVFRLSGRDRQRSASYYTPEVLTKCVVKHALAELLGLDDYAPEHGSSGIVDAVDLLDLTICEPALGSGAFANEAIDQLAREYLRRRQAEFGEVLDRARYDLELQKVKAHFALHQTYGVDLNATAVELAEVSLWLNAMYPGLKAPWFGLQLRRGNSLVGCRRATWTASQLGDRPWEKTQKGTVQPPIDRTLAEPLNDGEIHHFLLPGHGWAAVAGRKEAKELRPDECESLNAWRRSILRAPKKADAKRLAALAEGVEQMWKLAAERIRLTQQGLRRNIDVYGAPATEAKAGISRSEAERVLGDPDSDLGRLRTLMDAWTGLWFWPLDTGVRPPTWAEWLAVAHDLVRPDIRHGMVGQLDLFDDLAALLKAERDQKHGQVTVAQLFDAHAWLGIAVEAARREGAWHWALEFAPVFYQGGFDLQVGNPPWVRPVWREDLVLAELDPWWGVTDNPPVKAANERRTRSILSSVGQSSYLSELSTNEGQASLLGSPLERPALAGVQTNLFMVFMDTAWRNGSGRGIAGLLHPDSHLTDSRGASFRAETYPRLLRRWHFQNRLGLFEDLQRNGNFNFSVNIYRPVPGAVAFRQASFIFTPETVDASIRHDGNGPIPGIQSPSGAWDLRAHALRIIDVDFDTLGSWAALPGGGLSALEAGLVRQVTSLEQGVLASLARPASRVRSLNFHGASGWHEKSRKSDGTLKIADSDCVEWGDLVIQGSHFSILNPFDLGPSIGARDRYGFTERTDLEVLPSGRIPRTMLSRSCMRAEYDSRGEQLDGRPLTSFWRLLWRRRIDPGNERCLQPIVVPPGPSHVNSVAGFVAAADEFSALFMLSGLLASLPYDYLVKTLGLSDLYPSTLNEFPLPGFGPLLEPVNLRSAALNCLTSSFSDAWASLWRPAWLSDDWTDPKYTVTLCEAGPEWSTDVPLRGEYQRWLALVELDALAALILGLSAEQLCATYRSQFPVLRKNEHLMVFDADGRKICGYHHSGGIRQSSLQDSARANELPIEWKNLWKLYEQYEDNPDSVDWMGHYTAPFVRVDREASMTLAYNEFQRRLDAGEYGSE